MNYNISGIHSPGFRGAYCGIIWVRLNARKFTWKYMRGFREPFILIDSPLPAQEISPTLSNDPVLPLIEDVFLLKGATL